MHQRDEVASYAEALGVPLDVVELFAQTNVLRLPDQPPAQPQFSEKQYAEAAKAQEAVEAEEQEADVDYHAGRITEAEHVERYMRATRHMVGNVRARTAARVRLPRARSSCAGRRRPGGARRTRAAASSSPPGEPGPSEPPGDLPGRRAAQPVAAPAERGRR